MVITNKNIIKFKKENEEYIFQNEYLIQDIWKMNKHLSTNTFLLYLINISLHIYNQILNFYYIHIQLNLV